MELTQPHLAPPCHAAPENIIISQLIGILAFGRDTLPSETLDYGENLLDRLQQPSLPDTERENIAREARGFVGALENAGRDRNKGERIGQYADETARAIGEPADDLDGILDRRLEMVGKLGKRLENQAAREQYIENTRRAQACEFWRARKEVSTGETETAPETMQQVISECTDVINWLLTLANCPAEHRPFLDAAIGLYHQQLSTMIDSAETSPDEQGWFAADDFSIGSRIQGTRAGNVSVAAVKKTAQRARTAFFAWQESNGYGFVDFQPGGVRMGVKYKSLYRLPILEAAAGTLIEARKRPTWELNPTKAIRDEAREWLAWRLQRQAVVIERFYRPRQDAEAQMTRRHRTAVTCILTNLEQARLTGGDPQAYAQSLWREIVPFLTQTPADCPPELSTCIKECSGQVVSPAEMDVVTAAYGYAGSRRARRGIKQARAKLLAAADELYPSNSPTEPDPPDEEVEEMETAETPVSCGQIRPPEPPTQPEEDSVVPKALETPGPYGQICPQGPLTESEADMTKKARKRASRSHSPTRPESEAQAEQQNQRALNEIHDNIEQIKLAGGDPLEYIRSLLRESEVIFGPTPGSSPPTEAELELLAAAFEFVYACGRGVGVEEARANFLAKGQAVSPFFPSDSDPAGGNAETEREKPVLRFLS